jgi:hypothetical protein
MIKLVNTNDLSIFPIPQYMKLMGGYDFPGSNSGIDLYTLTGWIPEHIFVEDKDFVASNVWGRLMGGQKYGKLRFEEVSRKRTV